MTKLLQSDNDKINKLRFITSLELNFMIYLQVNWINKFNFVAKNPLKKPRLSDLKCVVKEV
jgi:hypothetical protein